MKTIQQFERDPHVTSKTRSVFTLSITAADGEVIDACIVGEPGCGPAWWEVSGDGDLTYDEGEEDTFEEAERKAWSAMLRASIRAVK